MSSPTGRALNDVIRQHGVVALVDLKADRIWFYPRGKLPAYVVAYLNIDDGRNARCLRDYLVSLGRGLVTD